MDFKEYQEAAMKTAVYEEDVYPFLALAEEVGEFLSFMAKASRGDDLVKRYGSEDKVAELIKKEAGDVLWQLTACLDELGTTLDEVADMNIDKLKKRQEEATLIGSGDER